MYLLTTNLLTTYYLLKVLKEIVKLKIALLCVQMLASWEKSMFT